MSPAGRGSGRRRGRGTRCRGKVGRGPGPPPPSSSRCCAASTDAVGSDPDLRVAARGSPRPCGADERPGTSTSTCTTRAPTTSSSSARPRAPPRARSGPCGCRRRRRDRVGGRLAGELRGAPASRPATRTSCPTRGSARSGTARSSRSRWCRRLTSWSGASRCGRRPTTGSRRTRSRWSSTWRRCSRRRWRGSACASRSAPSPAPRRVCASSATWSHAGDRRQGRGRRRGLALTGLAADLVVAVVADPSGGDRMVVAVASGTDPDRRAPAAGIRRALLEIDGDLRRARITWQVAAERVARALEGQSQPLATAAVRCGPDELGRIEAHVLGPGRPPPTPAGLLPAIAGHVAVATRLGIALEELDDRNGLTWFLRAVTSGRLAGDDLRRRAEALGLDRAAAHVFVVACTSGPTAAGAELDTVLERVAALPAGTLTGSTPHQAVAVVPWPSGSGSVDALRRPLLRACAHAAGRRRRADRGRLATGDIGGRLRRRARRGSRGDERRQLAAAAGRSVHARRRRAPPAAEPRRERDGRPGQVRRGGREHRRVRPRQGHRAAGHGRDVPAPPEPERRRAGPGDPPQHARPAPDPRVTAERLRRQRSRRVVPAAAGVAGPPGPLRDAVRTGWSTLRACCETWTDREPMATEKTGRPDLGGATPRSSTTLGVAGADEVRSRARVRPRAGRSATGSSQHGCTRPVRGGSATCRCTST